MQAFHYKKYDRNLSFMGILKVKRHKKLDRLVRKMESEALFPYHSAFKNVSALCILLSSQVYLSPLVGIMMIQPFLLDTTYPIWLPRISMPCHCLPFLQMQQFCNLFLNLISCSTFMYDCTMETENTNVNHAQLTTYMDKHKYKHRFSTA